MEEIQTFKDLMFADVETTGTEEEDRLCQVGYRCGAKDTNELFKPPLPIKYQAMAVHHITNEMVEDKPPFIGSGEHMIMNAMSSRVVFVAHNAKFDVDMFAKEGLEFPHVIDTLKIARHMDTAAVMESYGLQYIRYRTGIKIEAIAHDAWGDILVLEQVFMRQLRRIMENLACSADTAVDEMLEISSKPVLIRRFNFGKHEGDLVQDVYNSDPGYLAWLEKEKLKEPDGEEDWLFTLDQLRRR